MARSARRTSVSYRAGGAVSPHSTMVAYGVVPEDEAHASSGRTPSSDVPEPRPPAQGDRFVEIRDHALVRGPVAAAVLKEQRLPGVGQRHDERVIAPDAIVGCPSPPCRRPSSGSVPSPSIRAVCSVSPGQRTASPSGSDAEDVVRDIQSSADGSRWMGVWLGDAQPVFFSAPPRDRLCDARTSA